MSKGPGVETCTEGTHWKKLILHSAPVAVLMLGGLKTDRNC